MRSHTLIELLVVIAIVGILASVTLASVARGYNKAKRSANVSFRWHDKRLRIALHAEHMSRNELMFWLSKSTYTNLIVLTNEHYVYIYDEETDILRMIEGKEP